MRSLRPRSVSSRSKSLAPRLGAPEELAQEDGGEGPASVHLQAAGQALGHDVAPGRRGPVGELDGLLEVGLASGPAADVVVEHAHLLGHVGDDLGGRFTLVGRQRHADLAEGHVVADGQHLQQALLAQAERRGAQAHGRRRQHVVLDGRQGDAVVAADVARQRHARGRGLDRLA